MKLNVNKLYLELTRICNLECIHCLRGEAKNININNETIYNLFKEIKSIDKLLLTGGEVLLVPDKINEIANVLEHYNIEIKEIEIVTNGTILNQEIFDSLCNLRRQTSNFNLVLSDDKFHFNEIENKKLKDKRRRNEKIFKRCFSSFQYNKGKSINKLNLIDKKGRAINLTTNLLEEINKDKYQTNYMLTDDIRIIRKLKPSYNLAYIKDDNVFGTLSIDCFGNITDSVYSYDEDNKIIENHNINFNSLSEIINNYLYYNVLYNKENGVKWSLYYLDKINDVDKEDIKDKLLYKKKS